MFQRYAYYASIGTELLPSANLPPESNNLTDFYLQVIIKQVSASAEKFSLEMLLLITTPESCTNCHEHHVSA